MNGMHTVPDSLSIVLILLAYWEHAVHGIKQPPSLVPKQSKNVCTTAWENYRTGQRFSIFIPEHLSLDLRSL